MAVNLSIRGLWKTCLSFICISRPYWKLSQMPTSKGVAQCLPVLKTTASLPASSPPAATSGLRHRLLGLFRGFTNKCVGRRGSFPYWCVALGFLLPVTRNIKQTWLCVALLSALYHGVQPVLPWSAALLPSCSGEHLWRSGLRQGFLGAFLPYCHHGSDRSVTSSSCQHLS